MNRDFIPYGRQFIDQKDIDAVVEVLRSDWLTTGPLVEKFEKAVSGFVGTDFGIAVSSGTAALHTAMYSIGVGPGDEIIVPTITFAATANAVVMQGGTPVFADVTPHNLLIDPSDVEKRITARTKAIVPVDYAGHPADYDSLQTISEKYGLKLIADACHSLGAEYKGKHSGKLADISIFSFHPVKHITTGEGGMLVTDNPEYAQKARIFRNHGITSDFHQRAEKNSWFYEMTELGYNYRLTDIQCALGLSQLEKLPLFLTRRREIAKRYDSSFRNSDKLTLLKVAPEVSHAYHIYVIVLNLENLTVDRSTVFSDLRKRGIGVNAHYIPVHLHPYYRKNFNTKLGDCPTAEAVYERIISIPIFPAMSDENIQTVINEVLDVLNGYGINL